LWKFVIASRYRGIIFEGHHPTCLLKAVETRRIGCNALFYNLSRIGHPEHPVTQRLYGQDEPELLLERETCSFIDDTFGVEIEAQTTDTEGAV
jgi:hypothetical protein